MSLLRLGFMIVLPVLLMAGCSNQVHVYGTFDEVWERTQHAMQVARFETAGSGARHERLEPDRSKGTLRYVWSSGGFYDTVVVTLHITPAEETPGAACPALERTIRIDAWTWAFFGWAQVSDPHATDQAYKALMAEFSTESPKVASIGSGDWPGTNASIDAGQSAGEIDGEPRAK